MNSLRRENVSLKDEEGAGAVGGANTGPGERNRQQCLHPLMTQQLSRELTQAAANAETNLR